MRRNIFFQERSRLFSRKVISYYLLTVIIYYILYVYNVDVDVDVDYCSGLFVLEKKRRSVHVSVYKIYKFLNAPYPITINSCVFFKIQTNKILLVSILYIILYYI